MKKAKKKSNPKNNKLRNIIIAAIAIIGFGIGIFVGYTETSSADYIVETNAFFAPFEFYQGNKIVGVDVEIINRVAEKLGKTIKVKDVEFDVIIDNVEAGKIADAGAAGLTITDARKAKVDFSIPYYTSVQYAIFSTSSELSSQEYITWSDMSGKILGSQTGGTGYLFAQSEIEEGSLAGTNTTIKGFDNHQLAADAIKSNISDFAIADETVALMIVSKNNDLVAKPIYQSYDNPTPVEESYAIAVNKNQPELLEAFNSVLSEMLIEDADGQTEIERLVLKYSEF